MMTAAEHFLYLPEAKPGQGALLKQVWVPSECINFLPLERPTAPRSKWAKLLPWMLEDQLLADPASQHLIVAETGTEAAITVVSVAREQLQGWLERCHRLGWQPAAMTPDIFAVPWQSGQVAVLVDGERVLVRLAQWQGFAGDANWAWSVLRSRAKPGDLVFYTTGKADIPADLLGQGKPVVLRDPWSGVTAGASHGNLLQGEFKPRAHTGNWRTTWLLPVGAMGLALLCYMAWLVLDTRQLSQQSEQVLAAMQADFNSLYGTAFSGDSSELRDEVNFQLRLQAHQTQLQASGVWGLFQSIDPVLSGCDNCQLKTVSADSNGLLLQFASSAIAEQLPQLAAQPGLVVRLGALPDGMQELTVARSETP